MTSAGVARAQSSPRISFRVTILMFAGVLAAQSAWLLLAEFSRPRLHGLPTDAASAAVAARDRDRAHWVASIAAIRGDLWALSAFTYADLAIGETSAEIRARDSQVAQMRASIDRALDNAPAQSNVWLLRTGLALRYASEHLDPLEALRMAYYTGPSELTVVPLRLRLAAQTDRFGDVEIREFAIRDIRMLLATRRYEALAAADRAASNAGRQFIEHAVRDIDPSALEKIGPVSPSTQLLPN